MFQVFVAAMVSVEEVNTQLEEFIRNQQLANERFEPDGEQQDIPNNKFETKIAKLEEDAVKTEMRVARLEESLAFQEERIGGKSQERKELKENMAIDSQRLRVAEQMLTEHETKLAQSLLHFEKLSETTGLYDKMEGVAKIDDSNRVAVEGFRAESLEMIGEVVDKVKSHKAELEEITKKVETIN